MIQQVEKRGYRIRAVLFDFDGTLTRPGALDFAHIRQALSCPSDSPVLEYVQSIGDPAARQAVMQQLDQFEFEGARQSQPNSGAQTLVHWIKSLGLPVGIITRNSLGSVLRSLENFDAIGPDDFELIVTRDSDVAPKPSGDGIVWAAQQLDVACAEILEVGDYVFDPQAGLDAGALAVLLDPDNDPRLRDTACHFRIRRLEELRSIIQEGLCLPAGKLPNELLDLYLNALEIQDDALVVHPGVGQDVAAADIQDHEILVLKSDPITFAADEIGRYAVLVNANDIATAGATPRWFLATLLFPIGTSPSQVRCTMAELGQVSKRWHITLCGGHTEITDAVSRPVVVGMMAGTVARHDLVDKGNIRSGDAVLMTKQVAVEGLSIIARDFKELLISKGISDLEIDDAQRWLDQISILPEARIASGQQMAAAMHDVTEGGLATALAELSTAGGHKISVDMDRIPVPESTRRICSAVGVDPLGLIGSGSLLICCRPEHEDSLRHKISEAGIAVTRIGQVMSRGAGIEAFVDGKPVPWPQFAADEITKLYK